MFLFHGNDDFSLWFSIYSIFLLIFGINQLYFTVNLETDSSSYMDIVIELKYGTQCTIFHKVSGYFVLT